MRQSRFLWATVSVSFVAISLFPVYTVFFLAPVFKELLVENTKADAIQLASSISAFVVEQDKELKRGTLPTHLLDRLASHEGDRHLIKLRVFSPSGEIIYSTEPTEVGRLNQEAYFTEIAASGTSRAEIIPKESRSLENEVVPADVVETYVPITRRGRLLGVFELYHDVSKEQKDLDRLIYLLARIGGDEFAVLLTGGEAEFDRERLDGRLREIVEKHNKTNDRQYRLSVSAGFAYFDAAGTDTVEQWLHRADTMMYERKRQKKDV